MPGMIPPGTAVLWHGSDHFLEQAESPPPRKPEDPPPPVDPPKVVATLSVFATDLGGNVLVQVTDGPSGTPPEAYGTRALGIAFDGTNLWFSNQVDGGSATSVIDKRTVDGFTSLDTKGVDRRGVHTVDIAFDTKRGHLWQMDLGVQVDDFGNPAPRVVPPTLTRINPVARPGAKVLDIIEPPIALALPRGFEQGGGYGVTYDKDNDRLYFSFSNAVFTPRPAGAEPPKGTEPPKPSIAITAGTVMVMRPNPATNEFTGEPEFVEQLFPLPMPPLFGLAYQTGKGTLNGQGTLWAGSDGGAVLHLSLSGHLLATIPGDFLTTVVPPDKAVVQLAEGLEFVGG